MRGRSESATGTIEAQAPHSEYRAKNFYIVIAMACQKK